MEICTPVPVYTDSRIPNSALSVPCLCTVLYVLEQGMLWPVSSTGTAVATLCTLRSSPRGFLEGGRQEINTAHRVNGGLADPWITCWRGPLRP